MYICNDCNRMFTKPLVQEDYVGEYWGFPAYEKNYVCPHCNGLNYDFHSGLEGLWTYDVRSVVC